MTEDLKIARASVRFGGDWLATELPSVQLPALHTSTIRASAARAGQAHLIARAIVRERAVKEMLGRWVSELEPALVRDASGQVYGLTYAGQVEGGDVPIIVGIKGGVAI